MMGIALFHMPGCPPNWQLCCVSPVCVKSMQELRLRVYTVMAAFFMLGIAHISDVQCLAMLLPCFPYSVLCIHLASLLPKQLSLFVNAILHVAARNQFHMAH